MALSRRQKIQQMFEGFMALQKALGTRKDGFFQKYELSRSQVHILYSIAHCGALTIKDIAGKMGITSSAATQMVEGLVNAHFIQRIQDKNDRRIVNVQFSAAGKKKFETFRKEHMEKVCHTFEILSDKELDALISIPQKVLSKLTETHSN